MTQLSINLFSPAGEYVQRLRWKAIDCTLVERNIGLLTIQLMPEYRDDLFTRDSRIALLRAPDDQWVETGSLFGDTMWLLAKRARALDTNGQHTLTLVCQHPNALLDRRVVAYNEGSAQANKSDLASSVLYAYINENFVAATDTTRNVSSTHFVLDPTPGAAFGPTLDTAASYQGVLDILNDAAQSAAAQGSYIGYEVYVQQAPGPFRVRLYNHLRGTDRGYTSSQPLVIGPYTAKMNRVAVSEDWSNAISYVYAGGAGNQDERQVSPASDATLISQSPFGRYETFESFNTIGTAILTANAYKVLRDHRPRRDFAATVTPYAEQTSGAVYGINYNWGDVVGALFNAPVVVDGQIQSWVTYRFDCRVNPVHLRATRDYDEYGNVGEIHEEIEITLQSVDST